MTSNRDVEERLKDALADRYEIQREVGVGGMAVVFLAHDLKHDRPVALKVMRPELAASLGAERFLREIQISAKLNHPHILPLHESGEADGVLFYVMPYVEGESLRDRMEREGQLPLDEALVIAREVADGLGHAHSLDIVHRDIKPENILLSGGHAVITDFGVARAVSAAGGRITKTGGSVGSPLYMSPEQASGQVNLDGRSDLYSLACMLYEMLAGEPPFSGQSMQALIAKHAMEPPPDVRVLRASVPEPIDEAIRKALSKSPADRFRTVNDFAAILSTVAATGEGGASGKVTTPAFSENVATDSSGSGGGGWKAKRVRWRIGVGMVAGIGAFVGLSAIVAKSFDRGGETSLQADLTVSDPHQVTFSGQLPRWGGFYPSPDGMALVYKERITQAWLTSTDGLGGPRQLPTGVHSVWWPKAGTGLVATYTGIFDQQQYFGVVRLQVLEENIRPLADGIIPPASARVSSDCIHWLQREGDGTPVRLGLVCVPLDGSRPPDTSLIDVPALPPETGAVVLSPNPTWGFVSAPPDSAFVVNVTTGQVTDSTVFNGHEEAEWSNDGTAVFYHSSHGNGGGGIFSVPFDTVTGTFTGEPGILLSGRGSEGFFATRNGSRIFFPQSAPRENLWMGDAVPEASAPTQLTHGTGGKNGPLLSPDGTQVLYWRQGSLFISELSSGSPRRLGSFPGFRGGGDMRWSLDGKRVGLLEQSDTASMLHLVEISTGLGRQIEIGGLCNALAWHPDNVRLALSCRREEVSDVAGVLMVNPESGSQLWIAEAFGDGHSPMQFPFNFLLFGQDGETLYGYEGMDNGIDILTLEDGQVERFEWGGWTTFWDLFGWAADGSLLFAEAQDVVSKSMDEREQSLVFSPPSGLCSTVMGSLDYSPTARVWVCSDGEVTRDIYYVDIGPAG